MPDLSCGYYDCTNYYFEFDAETGEVVDNPKRSVLEHRAIEEDAACDGYYCIVISETNWEPGRVIDTYRELWRIEETFKVTDPSSP